MLPEFVRYAGAGAIGAAAQYALLIAVVQFARTDAVTASTAGAILGALVNYGPNHRFTFASTRAHHVSLPRYTAVALGGIVLNGLVLVACAHHDRSALSRRAVGGNTRSLRPSPPSRATSARRSR
jgi:putative flippase GtrA